MSDSNDNSIIQRATMTYRRRPKSDVWHFIETCRWWPVGIKGLHYKEQDRKPKSGELCNECMSKAKKRCS